jgi:hypothetical protein
VSLGERSGKTQGPSTALGMTVFFRVTVFSVATAFFRVTVFPPGMICFWDDGFSVSIALAPGNKSFCCVSNS